MSSAPRYTFRRGLVLFFVVALVFADFCFVAFSPAYRYYKQRSRSLDERLDRWERGFKADYITAINSVASAIASNSVSPSVSSPFGGRTSSVARTSPSEVVPFMKPLDIKRKDFRYFECGDISGFSLGGRLVFRVGDFFLGRQIVHVDRFGAVLDDGSMITGDIDGGSVSSSTRSAPPSQKEVVKDAK